MVKFIIFIKTILVTKGDNDVAKRNQGLVDVGCFLEDALVVLVVRIRTLTAKMVKTYKDLIKFLKLTYNISKLTLNTLN